MGEGNSFSLFTFRGGVPNPALDGGGVPCLRFSGGVPGLRFSGGRSQVSDFRGGSQVSDFQGEYPVSVKGKNFDTRFGLIHVQTGKKIFVEGPPLPPPPPPPPLVKGKIFDTRFGLIHVQTGKIYFLSRDPPPPGIARNCYGHAAGGMPLAFTQEDFLVDFNFYWTTMAKLF